MPGPFENRLDNPAIRRRRKLAEAKASREAAFSSPPARMATDVVNPVSVEGAASIAGAYASKGFQKAIRSGLGKALLGPVASPVLEFMLPENKIPVEDMTTEERKRETYNLLELAPFVGDAAAVARSMEDINREGYNPRVLARAGTDIGLSIINPVGGSGPIKRAFESQKSLREGFLERVRKRQEAEGGPYKARQEDLNTGFEMVTPELDTTEFGLEGLNEEVQTLIRNKPRIQTLLENNPDRLANLEQLTYDSDTRRRIVKVLEASDAFYDIANTGHIGSVSPARFDRLSKAAADAIEKGQNPLELLLDGKLTPSDFNARNGYTVAYKPLSKTEYGAQQTATSYQGSYRMSEITGIPRGSAPRVSDEADLDTRYSEAVESGFVPHRIEVITPQGTKRTYTPQKEHSIPKSPAGKRLQAYFKEQVASTKDASVIKQQKAIQRELDAIINARDTFFDLPPYYNRLKADMPTEEFKNILLNGGQVEVRTKKGKAIVNKKPDPEAFERFYGEDSPVAEGLRRRQEVLTGRLYDWGRRNNVPEEFVDDLIRYL